MTNTEKTALLNGTIINEGKKYIAHLIIEESKIASISESVPDLKDCSLVFNLEGMLILPGIIDDQVHFREPGLSHKGDIETESKACVAGGVTTYFEMPNTNPPTTNLDALEKKFELGKEKSYANYSFYLGATNNNVSEIKRLNPRRVAGVKIFMGSSTGNLLVDDDEALDAIFSQSPVLIATHCEDEKTIKENEAKYRLEFGDSIPMEMHATIRSEEACYLSSKKAVELANRHNSRLHVLHISTKRELELFDHTIPIINKRITAEACVHHLYFSDRDYKSLGWRIKWNPSVKTESDKLALQKAVRENQIDIIASDHAPHTIDEKTQIYWKSPSGGPLVQHSLLAMLDLHQAGQISLEEIVNKMCHAPAQIYQVKQRGFIREGYFADIVVVNPKGSTSVKKENLLYKCGWSPFEGKTFDSKIYACFINGGLAYKDGHVSSEKYAMEVEFERT